MLHVVEVKAKITSHIGMVKGVAWDPVGKYLASQVSHTALPCLRLAVCVVLSLPLLC